MYILIREKRSDKTVMGIYVIPDALFDHWIKQLNNSRNLKRIVILIIDHDKLINLILFSSFSEKLM